MSKISYKRLGVALMSLAMPLVVVVPVAAQPSAPEVSSVEIACLGAGFDINTCTGAVQEGVYDVVEDNVNGDLADQGVDYVVDVGIAAPAEPGNFPYDINAIAVNPLPPLPPAPLAPSVPAVPFQ
jgi:hypothetical protein